MMEKKPDLIISHELAQEILNYLQNKPYIEVAALIEKILTLEPIEEK